MTKKKASFKVDADALKKSGGASFTGGAGDADGAEAVAPGLPGTQEQLAKAAATRPKAESENPVDDILPEQFKAPATADDRITRLERLVESLASGGGLVAPGPVGDSAAPSVPADPLDQAAEVIRELLWGLKSRGVHPNTRLPAKANAWLSANGYKQYR